MIQQAVILAAGNGSRLKRSENDLPKPLRKVCGLSLIKRAILTGKQAGVREFVIVVGYKGDEIIRELSQDESLGVQLQFIKNPNYHQSNGVSLLAAKEAVRGNFLLFMADHIFEKKAFEKMVRLSLAQNEVVLAVDKKLNDIFDLEDVTKVWLAKDRVQEIGKNLSQYNAFDTGLFACTPYLFEVLEKHLAEKNDVSLSQGIQSLAAHQLVRTCDISDCFWQDVDTPESMKYAQKIMFQKLRKPTDGVVSRYFNRYISTSLTRLLVKTPVTANQITFVVSLIGILSGYFISSGRYWDGVIGGILFQLTSILDGCDGELSKLKLTASKTGEWLDTIGDNLTYLSFLVGVSMASHRILHGDFEVFEAAFMLAGFGFLMVVVAFYLIYHANSGTLMAIQKDFEEEAKSRPESKGLISFFGTKLKFLMKRDFFALFFMTLCILDHVPLILHLSFVGVNTTWIILLSYKRDIFKIPAKAKQLEERR